MKLEAFKDWTSTDWVKFEHAYRWYPSPEYGELFKGKPFRPVDEVFKFRMAGGGDAMEFIFEYDGKTYGIEGYHLDHGDGFSNCDPYAVEQVEVTVKRWKKCL